MSNHSRPGGPPVQCGSGIAPNSSASSLPHSARAGKPPAPSHTTSGTPESSRALAGITLDPGQLEAITHGEGPLRILAPPGTGKTFTLVHAMAYLIERDNARPHELLAVTFTRKATEELRRRTIDLLGISRAASLNVWTIHKLCRKIVRAHAADVGRGPGFEVFNRAKAGRLVSAIIGEGDCESVDAELRRSGLAASGELVSDLLDEISLAKNALRSPGDYHEAAEHPTPCLVAAVWREYERQLELANALDFDDLVRYAVTLLRNDKRLRAHYRERYRRLFIDEYQDVNVAQRELVRLLMAPAGNLTVAGDDDQCLYGFRLAGPGSILDFTADFPGARTVMLTVNRRNRPKILRAALRVISNNETRLEKALIPLMDEGGSLTVRGYVTDDDEAADIARLTCTELALGRDPREILILCSWHRPLVRLQRRLESCGVRVRLLGGSSLWERSETRDAIAYLRVLANPFDTDAFRRALGAPSDERPFTQGNVAPPRRCSPTDTRRIIAFAEQHGIDLINATLRIEEIDGVRAAARDGVQELAIALDRTRRTAWPEGHARATISDLVTAALNIGGGPVRTYEYLQDHANSAAVREEAGRVLEDLLSLRRAAERYEEAPGLLPRTLIGFLETLEAPDEHELADGGDDRVTLATGHAGKGGEAETVIVIGAEDGLLPAWRAPLEEQRRLFYVASTRAKENLLFTWVATRDGRRTDGPSRFLAEAGLI